MSAFPWNPALYPEFSISTNVIIINWISELKISVNVYILYPPRSKSYQIFHHLLPFNAHCYYTSSDSFLLITGFLYYHFNKTFLHLLPTLLLFHYTNLYQTNLLKSSFIKSFLYSTFFNKIFAIWFQNLSSTFRTLTPENL